MRDEAITSIVETLRQTGELDNTLILYLRQRLLPRRAPRRNGKVLWYEPSIHLPLMMRWTGNQTLPRGVHAVSSR
jgi:arylsulfatase A-like enzyme